MKSPWFLAVAAAAAVAHAAAVPFPESSAVAGVRALVQRRLPSHVGAFDFALVNGTSSATAWTATNKTLDIYTVTSAARGKVRIEGNSVGAILTGLRSYLSATAHVDIWWFVGSQLDAAPASLPAPAAPLHGKSVVPWRYHFNTVTTSYSSTFWSWADWELQLDWMALRGVNLALAWIGVERIFIEVFRDFGFADADIESFLAGPAFLAWNHFGNIQGTWSATGVGALPFSWADAQFALQRRILRRMADLGITPILPAFPGFVPASIRRLYPNASVTASSVWEGFADRYTEDTFLDPLDPLFSKLQAAFIAKQRAYYGSTASSFYALDQFNENTPASGDVDYLRTLTAHTWQSLKAADAAAVWVMQSWMFTSAASFWSEDRIAAYLGGVAVDADMLVLDLAADSSPVWQRTSAYHGKPWVWCELHDYGGNMGLYGQIANLTVNATEARRQASNLVGYGLAMEGQEGNEIVYDLLLAQAWSSEPLDTEVYFDEWVASRYGMSPASALGSSSSLLSSAWQRLRSTVYNNTALASNAVPKAILELRPSTSGLVNRTGHHPTTLNYDTAVLVAAWHDLYRAGRQQPALFANPAYHYDLVDWTRQVLANAVIPLYQSLVAEYGSGSLSSSSSPSRASILQIGARMDALLGALDDVLATNHNFRLSTWIAAARGSSPDPSNRSLTDFFEFQARNQITLWGPNGEITDYASKSWAGLVAGYYAPRWRRFVDYLVNTPPDDYNQSAYNTDLLAWEQRWVAQTMDSADLHPATLPDLQAVLARVVRDWSDVFGK